MDKCYAWTLDRASCTHLASTHFLPQIVYTIQKNTYILICVATESLYPVLPMPFTDESRAERNSPLVLLSLFPMFWAKLHRNYGTVSKWYINDQKPNDSSMARSRLALAEPNCLSSGTRTGESSSIPGTVPSSLVTFTCPHISGFPEHTHTQGFVTCIAV